MQLFILTAIDFHESKWIIPHVVQYWKIDEEKISELDKTCKNLRVYQIKRSGGNIWTHYKTES